jgi:hypothetical protein
VPLALPAGATSEHSLLLPLGASSQLALATPISGQTVLIDGLHLGFAKAFVHLAHGQLVATMLEAQSSSTEEQLLLFDVGARLGWFAWCCLQPCISATDAATMAMTYVTGEAAIAFAQCWSAGSLPCLLGLAHGDEAMAQELAKEHASALGDFVVWLRLHGCMV